MTAQVDRQYFDPAQVYSNKPFQPSGDYAVNEALSLSMIPADTVRQIRPRLPLQVNPDDLYHSIPTVESVVGPPTMEKYRLLFNGTPHTRIGKEEQMWSGSSRNSSMSQDPMG